MRHTLRQHILYLENTIQTVRDRLTKPRLSPEELQDLELQLSLAESALEHYRRAYELELSVSGPEPPHRPDSQSVESGDAKDRNGDGKKGGGRAARARRTRPRTRGGLVFAVTAASNKV